MKMKPNLATEDIVADENIIWTREILTNELALNTLEHSTKNIINLAARGSILEIDTNEIMEQILAVTAIFLAYGYQLGKEEVAQPSRWRRLLTYVGIR